MATITRFSESPRISQSVVFGDVVYLAGQVADDPSKDFSSQMQEVLSKVDRFLAVSNSEKGLLLSAQVFLRDISDFSLMNQLWQSWLEDCKKPARTTIQAILAKPEYRIEITVIAAQREHN